MRGFLTIKKVYDDRVEEVPVERDNSITDGFGIAITNLLTSSPFKTMRDFQIGYWAAGSGTHYNTETYSEAQPDSIRNCLYELADPVSSVDVYGTESIIEADEGIAITVEQKWVQDSVVVYTTSGGVFAKLPPQNVTTIEGDAIRVKINIDRKGLAGETLREFGLYINNPEGYTDDDRMILAAYKPLMDPIEKTEEFSIDLEWVIDFSNSDFFSDKIAESIYFVPTVKGVEPGDQYTKALSANETFNAQIETLNPVGTSGTLHLYTSGDAVEGTHYTITSTSAVFLQGEQLKNVRVQNVGTGWFTPKVLRVGLSSYDGDRNIVDKFYYGKPPYIDFVLTSSATSPTLTFDSAVIADTTQTILLDSSSNEPMTVYFDVSAEAGGTYTGPFSTTIPSGVTSHDFTVTATAGYDYIVSAYNPYNSNVNLLDKSTSFASHEVREPLLGYSDVSSSPEDFDSPNDRRYRNFIGGPSYFHVGVDSTKDFQTSTVYATPPPQPFLLKTEASSTGPFPYAGSEIVYVPKEYYEWPESDGSDPYITASRVPDQVDGLGRSSGHQSQDFRSGAGVNRSFLLRVAVKDFGTYTIPGASEEDNTINSASSFCLELGVSGKPGVTESKAPYAFQKVKFCFDWTGGVPVDRQIDVPAYGHGYDRDVEDIGDGWYICSLRLTLTTFNTPPNDYRTYPGSEFAGLTADGSGAQVYYRVYPVDMVGTETPSDMLGTQFGAISLINSYGVTDPIVPKADQFGTPLGGVRTNNSGQTETRFTL